MPLSDYDLNILSSLKNELNDKVIFVIPSKKIIDICLNKIKTYHFLKFNNFDTDL